MAGYTIVEAETAEELIGRTSQSVPDAVVVGPDFDYAPHGESCWLFQSGNLVESSWNPIEYWFMRVEYPHNVLDIGRAREFISLYEQISGGSALVCVIDPDKPSAIQFCRDMMAAQHTFSVERAMAGSFIEGAPSSEKGDGTGLHHMEIPVPVGWSSLSGNRFRDTGSVLRWTAVWALTLDPFMEEINRELEPFLASLEGMEKEDALERAGRVLGDGTWDFPESIAHDNPMECWDRILRHMRNLCSEWGGSRGDGRIASGLRLPGEISLEKRRFLRKFQHYTHLLKLSSDAMLSPEQARASFAESAHLKLIDTDRTGWPIAFTRRYGDGSITVIPACGGCENLAGELDSLSRDRIPLNGCQLVVEYFTRPGQPSGRGVKEPDRRYTIRIEQKAVEKYREYSHPSRTIHATVLGEEGDETVPETGRGIRLSWMMILRLAYLAGLRDRHRGGLAYRTMEQRLELNSCCDMEDPRPVVRIGLGEEVWRPAPRGGEARRLSSAVPGYRKSMEDVLNQTGAGGFKLFSGKGEIADPSNSFRRFSCLKLADEVRVEFIPSARAVLAELGKRLPKGPRPDVMGQIMALFEQDSGQ